MSRALLLILGVLIFAPHAFAQGDGGIPREAQVDKLFAAWDKPESPGCAVAIIKDGRVVQARGYGIANLDYGIPISSKTVFNIASTSKQFTAASIAILARQGKLSLDDDIHKFLPELPRYSYPVTIRQLIYHTSGIREYPHLLQLAGIFEQNATTEDVMKMIARQKELNFTPGSEYLYSNSGYILLAQIVKAVSGKSLREFAEENIFQPLEMSHTSFVDDGKEIVKNRATGYSARGGGFSVELALHPQTGPSGLLTSVDDLVLWDQNFYANKMAPDLISQLITPGTLNSGAKIDYAFGLDVETYRGLRMIGHGGAFYGFTSDMIRFPDQHFSVICLCNLSNIESGRLTRQIADIYLADDFKRTEHLGNDAGLPAPKVVQVPEQELTAVAGSYFNFASNNFRRIYVKNGKLFYSRGGSESELAPLGNNRFLMLGVPDRIEITFKSPQPGAPLQMFTAANGKVFIVHDSVKPATYTSQQLAEFTGKYHSNEIEATYTITQSGDKLILARNGLDTDTPLAVQFAETFFAPGTGSLRFTRNKQNRISGFLLSTGRVRALRFEKVN
jgi:CubicO group peptidase (beta-lactamase class C family)